MIPVRWSAVEVLSKRLVLKASDVWSFGVVVWECCAWSTPYENLTSPQVMDYVVQGGRLTKPIVVDCGEKMWKLIETCFQDEPNDRPKFGDLALQLEKLKDEVFEISKKWEQDFVVNKLNKSGEQVKGSREIKKSNEIKGSREINKDEKVERRDSIMSRYLFVDSADV
jgi:serine/threonine protein kinase